MASGTSIKYQDTLKTLEPNLLLALHFLKAFLFHGCGELCCFRYNLFFFVSPTPILLSTKCKQQVCFCHFRYHSLFPRACVHDSLSCIVDLGTRKFCAASQTNMAPLLTVSTAIFRKFASYIGSVSFFLDGASYHTDYLDLRFCFYTLEIFQD